MSAGTETITATFTPTNSNTSASDYGVVDTVLLDLTLDSNNDGSVDPNTDDPANAVPGAVGEIVGIDDSPGPDGLPGYAEGFNLPPSVAAAVAASGNFGSNSNPGGTMPTFTPVILTLVGPLDLSDTTLEIVYSSSNPANVTFDGTNVDAAPGDFRLWTKDGSQIRSTAPVDAGSGQSWEILFHRAWQISRRPS